MTAIQLHGRAVPDELLGHPIRFPWSYTCGIIREDEARAVQLHASRFRPNFGTCDVVGEYLKAVRVEVHPVGAFGLRRTQHRATFCIEECLDESDLSVFEVDLAQAPHMGYYVSGRMKVVMDDGEEAEFGPGDFAVIPPGHDAWTVGNDPCVVIDWQGLADYAKGT